MKQRRITHYIRPSFWIFLGVAALLWYGNKLGGRYTTEVELPVEIRNDFSSRLWIERPVGLVTCRAEGLGARLLAYKMGLGDIATIPMSQLTLVPVHGSERQFRVDKNSLAGALALTVKDLRIQEILDTALTISVSPVESRRMAVRSRIGIGTARQYMQVGAPTLEPDSVDVRGPKAVLDTMAAVYTELRHYRDLTSPVAGSVELQPSDNILLAVKNVDYRVDIQPFTQQTLTLPVRVSNLPDGMQAVIVPSRVTVMVNVPLRDYERIREERLHACVDYREIHDAASGKYAVRIDSLPLGTAVMRIEPQYVEPFFTKR